MNQKKTLLGLFLAAAAVSYVSSYCKKHTVSSEVLSAEPIVPSKLLSALKAADDATYINSDATGPFELAPLEYDYTTLEPAISESTLRLHHDSVHRDYINALNTALARYPQFYEYTLHELLLYPDRVPLNIRAEIFRHAGGAYNHGLLWKILGPAYATEPTGNFLDTINQQFGSFENFKRVLISAGESVQGTGHGWLALNPYGRLIVVTTEDEFTPIPLRMVPLIPLDMWEHAHYQDYKGQRTEYLESLFTLIDWDRVGNRYQAAFEAFNE